MHCFHHQFLCLQQSFPFHFLSASMLHSYAELLALHSSCKQPISALEEASPIQHLATFPKLDPITSCSGSHSSLTSSTCILLLPRYVNCLTVSTTSHCFSSCSTASPIFPSHFLRTKFLENVAVTLFTVAHLLWGHIVHTRLS